MADDLSHGFVQFFSHERVDVGFPPRWHVDPFSGHQFPIDRHWSQIGDFGAGDIKLVWETNRFSFVFSLVRSYWRTQDERIPELFWQLVEDWRASNPPETGSNWKCGQEISLRMMAWCFGLYGFLQCAASTAERIGMLAQMIAVSGHRIESNIGYALSQQNNHGLSEAMGLWTIGSLFPEFTDARRWAEMGRSLLEVQGQELVYDDGAFSQHSMNYHRVMLHDYLWSMRLGDVQERPFSAALRDRIGRAGEFAFQLQDESTGFVPCYGQNDGALILPLTNCDYRDFRPVVQSTQFLANGTRPLPAGAWDEELFWLFGPDSSGDLQNAPLVEPAATSNDALQATRLRTDFDAPEGGYTTLRSRNGFAMTRAANFKHRPAQADMLHVDIWWRGENIAIDPGTYSYNAAPPWDNRLSHTAHHNTVAVDGKDQMDRAGRFLWLPWLTSKSFGRKSLEQSDVAYVDAGHHGYQRLADPVIHRRVLIRLGQDHWMVVDALKGQQTHLFRLHWLLLDAPFDFEPTTGSIELQTSSGRYCLASATSGSEKRFEVTRAAPDSALGWRSDYYHERQPAISFNLESTSSEIVFATVLGPDARTPVIDRNVVQARGANWSATVSLNPLEAAGIPLIASIDAKGFLPLPHLPIESQTQRIQSESP